MDTVRFRHPYHSPAESSSLTEVATPVTERQSVSALLPMVQLHRDEASEQEHWEELSDHAFEGS